MFAVPERPGEDHPSAGMLLTPFILWLIDIGAFAEKNACAVALWWVGITVAVPVWAWFG